VLAADPLSSNRINRFPERCRLGADLITGQSNRPNRAHILPAICPQLQISPVIQREYMCR
jgi:hypothetical protein